MDYQFVRCTECGEVVSAKEISPVSDDMPICNYCNEEAEKLMAEGLGISVAEPTSSVPARFNESEYEKAKRSLVSQVLAMVIRDYPELEPAELRDEYDSYFQDALFAINEIADEVFLNL